MKVTGLKCVAEVKQNEEGSVQGTQLVVYVTHLLNIDKHCIGKSRRKMETMITEDQLGSWKREEQEKQYQHYQQTSTGKTYNNRQSYILLIDFQAFEKVKWEHMLRILEIGVTHKDRKIMWTLCREERGALKNKNRKLG